MLNLGASADLSSLHLSTSSSSSFPACLPFENSIIISGGTRGLGRVVAAQLARRNVTLVLTSVSGQVDEAFLLDIKRRTHKTVVKQCDWSDESAVAKLLAWARESLPVVSLIVHAAGRMTPCNIVDMTEATFDDVVACKLNSLKEAMAFPSMEQWVISAISAVWSQSGGAHYTAASLFQQRMAESCIAKGIRMTSGAFGPFGGVGMAARYSDDMRALGLVALSPGETAPSLMFISASANAAKNSTGLDPYGDPNGDDVRRSLPAAAKAGPPSPTMPTPVPTTLRHSVIAEDSQITSSCVMLEMKISPWSARFGPLPSPALFQRTWVQAHDAGAASSKRAGSTAARSF